MSLHCAVVTYVFLLSRVVLSKQTLSRRSNLKVISYNHSIYPDYGEYYHLAKQGVL